MIGNFSILLFSAASQPVAEVRLPAMTMVEAVEEARLMEFECPFNDVLVVLWDDDNNKKVAF